MPGVDVREALPRRKRTGRRPVTTIAEAQLTGRLVGDAEAGYGGEESTEAGGVAVTVIGGVDVRVTEVYRCGSTRWPRASAARSVGARAVR